MNKPVFAMMMDDRGDLVNPIWDFITRRTATDAYIYPPIDFNRFISGNNLITRGDDKNFIVLKCDMLFPLIEFLSYVVGCYNDNDNKKVPEIEQLSDHSKIYLFYNEHDRDEYIKYGDNGKARPIMEFNTTIRHTYGVPLPDHPYSDYWMDRSLTQINAMPISRTIYVPDEYLVGLFNNIQVERIVFTSDRGILPYIIRKMFKNTRCRVLEMSFFNCEDDYLLTAAPFYNIDFRYRDKENFTGASYITLNYKRESTNYVDMSRFYMNLE